MNKLVKNTCLILGISGQDGSYLADYLLKSKKLKVHGMIRHNSSMKNRSRIDHLFKNKNLTLHYGDIVDYKALNTVIAKVRPEVIYNLAGQSHIKVSSFLPILTTNVNAVGCLYVLEIIKSFNKKIKFYQASTSELFGIASKNYQNEKSKFNPANPYAISKLFAFHIAKYYREAFGIYAVNGILFNHESYRRGSNYVTKKIIEGAVKIKKNIPHIIELGNIHARRDWGYAPEYIEGIYKMMIQPIPDDYVLATGETHSVKAFVDETFKQLGIRIKWYFNENKFHAKRIDKNKIIIKSNRNYQRDVEVNFLKGDYKKALKILKWRPKVKFKKLISVMLEDEIKNFNL